MPGRNRLRRPFSKAESFLVLRFLNPRKKRRGLPEGIRIYAIGDVHGRVDLLDQVFAKIDAHLLSRPAVRPVQILIGDYIDRGPASRETLDRLLTRAQSHEMIFLKGNHETFIPEFLRRPAILRDWSQLGGIETLMSYGLKPSLSPDTLEQNELAAQFQSVFPRSHQLFLGSLQSSFLCGGFFFVHAGVKPRVPLSEQREEDLLWIRDEFLLYEQDFGKIVVHGHTPVREIDIRPNRINIDTGAYATGRLTCLVVEGDRFEPL